LTEAHYLFRMWILVAVSIAALYLTNRIAPSHLFDVALVGMGTLIGHYGLVNLMGGIK
jgi:hypothetical protein